MFDEQRDRELRYLTVGARGERRTANPAHPRKGPAPRDMADEVGLGTIQRALVRGGKARKISDSGTALMCSGTRQIQNSTVS